MSTKVTGDIAVSLEGVTIGYDKKAPLAKIPSLRIKNGEILAIAGPSGIGKSTLLKTIAGLVPPLAGKIEVCGARVPSKPFRGQLGYIPQRLGLIRHASVFHNVLIGSRARFCGPIDLFASKEAKEWAKRSIIQMGLEDKTWEPIRRLSGGQQRRVATARTLAQRPNLILADEFLSELDEETMLNVIQAVVEYSREEAAAIVLIEHDIGRARRIADRLVVMDDGRLNPFLSETKTMEVRM